MRSLSVTTLTNRMAHKEHRQVGRKYRPWFVASDHNWRKLAVFDVQFNGSQTPPFCQPLHHPLNNLINKYMYLKSFDLTRVDQRHWKEHVNGTKTWALYIMNGFNCLWRWDLEETTWGRVMVAQFPRGFGEKLINWI